MALSFCRQPQLWRSLGLKAHWGPTRWAHIDVTVPTMGESITEGTIQTLRKRIGDMVQADEVIAVIETDKISVDVSSPSEGKLVKVDVREGDTVRVGDIVVKIETDPTNASGDSAENSPADDSSPQEEQPQNESHELDVNDASVLKFPSSPESEPRDTPSKSNASIDANWGDLTSQKESSVDEGQSGKGQKRVNWSSRKEKRVPLSRMRLRIAERLKEAQSNGVLLTTFQECDMSEVSSLRKQLGKQFLSQYGVKLGFNSFFLMASAKALRKWPGINSAIEGKNLVERDFIDISVAVATPTGLMVPVIRDVDKKGMVSLEEELSSLAKKAREGKLSLDEMSGGTFTISNGGIYGSLMGTPIINPPQSAILGMHSIQDRPVVRNGQVVIRPIMYLALTYDHRIVDGREAVSFLKDVAEMIENPAKLLMDK